MKALILAGGSVAVTPALRDLCREARLVVAADSGLRHAAALGVSPDIVVGDFDSVTGEVLAQYPDLPRLEHPPEKDLLDLELALDYAQGRGATHHLIVGGLGDRFDQSLAAVLIAARWKREGRDVSLQSGDRAVHLLAGEDEVKLELPHGQRFSLLSLNDSVVSLENAKYPLECHTLPFGVGRGVSNEVTRSPLRVKLAGGLVALIVEAMREDSNKLKATSNE